MPIPGIDHKESFFTISAATFLIIGIGLTLFFVFENWICELVDSKSGFLEGKFNIKL